MKDLQGARDMFKREHKSDWRWAQTLIADVLHSHPKLESSKAVSSSAAAVEAGASAPQGQQGGPEHSSPTFPMGRGRTVRRAAKELASGEKFRSLYGLARDEGQTHRKESEQAKAATSSLSQVHGRGGARIEARGDEPLRKLVDDSVRRAERRLAAKNRLALLHEEAALQRQFERSHQESQGGPRGSASRVHRATLAPQYVVNPVQQQQHRVAAQATQGREQHAWQLAPLEPLPGQAPVTSFSSATTPDQAASIGMQQAHLALARLSRQKAFSQALDQVPDAQQQQLAQSSLTVEVKPSAQDPALSGVSPAVPVVNLNLAPGQKLAPGKYE